ncbi:hypothetical protein D3C75_1027430 [compost metagenome]
MSGGNDPRLPGEDPVQRLIPFTGIAQHLIRIPHIRKRPNDEVSNVYDSVFRNVDNGRIIRLPFGMDQPERPSA